MKRKWHFKKWFQHLVELVSTGCGLCLLGVSEFTCHNAFDYLAVFAIAGVAIGGFISLSLFGDYKDEL